MNDPICLNPDCRVPYCPGCVTTIIGPALPPGEPIGSFRNEWRRRTVRIYAHATDADKVITVGYPFDGGAPVICEEPRATFRGYIGRFGALWQ